MGIRLEIDMPEHHYNKIMAFDSVSLGRVPYKGIIMYAINAIKHGKVLDQEPILEFNYQTLGPLEHTTLDRVEVGTDGNMYRLTISYGSE